MFSDNTYNFDYDGVNRLTTAEYSGTGSYNTSYDYDKNGNLEFLSREGKLSERSSYALIDELSYSYTGTGNQLKSVTDIDDSDNQNNGFSDNGSFSSLEYTYDDNGNMITDLNKDLNISEYNYLNLPQQISNNTDATNKINYLYDAAGIKLRKQTKINNATEKTLDYIGNFVYEDNELRYILTNEGRVMVNTGGTYEYQYFLKDHLGSINYILDEDGTIAQEMNFDAWGRRRDAQTWTYNNVPTTFMFDRGFTMHEHLDAFKLINMNGRVYDPVVARFLSPDPFVQMPEYSQNFNRYSYVLNNPLRFTDPSGFIFMEYFDWFINNQTGDVYYNSEYREGDESKIEGEGWVWFGENDVFSKDSRFNDYQIILKNSDLLPEIYEKKEYDKSLVFNDAKIVSFNVEATFKGQKALIFMKRQGYDFVKEIYKFHKDVTTDYLPDLVQVTIPHDNSRIESILSYQYVYKDLVFKESKILSEYKHAKNGRAELIGWAPAFSIRNQSWTVRQDIYGKSSLGNFGEKYLLPLEKILPWKSWYKDFWKFIYKK